MKTKYWILLLAVILIACIGLSIPLLTGQETAAYAQVISNGHPVTTVDLDIDQSFSVSTPLGNNTITVKDGKIGVTQASCPDHYCMDRGMCDRGAQIVCLPNKLVIRFLASEGVDTVVG